MSNGLYPEPTLIGGGSELRELVEFEQLDVQKFTSEEIDMVVSALTRHPIYSQSVYSAVLKLTDVSAADELPESLRRGCQKCDDAIDFGEKRINRFGNFYHPDCVNEEGAEDAMIESDTV